MRSEDNSWAYPVVAQKQGIQAQRGRKKSGENGNRGEKNTLGHKKEADGRSKSTGTGRQKKLQKLKIRNISRDRKVRRGKERGKPVG